MQNSSIGDEKAASPVDQMHEVQSDAQGEHLMTFRMT
jgi:hypothetical protein